MIKRFKAVLALFIVAIVARFSPAIADDSTVTSDPSKVEIVTSDISRFWRAFDEAQSAPDPEQVYATEYFTGGSPAIAAFTPKRLRSPAYLAERVAQYREYYRAARPQMEHIPEQRPRIVDDFARFKALYPRAVFPRVYFVVGVLNTAGTSVDGVGLILGAEMLARPDMLNVSMPGFRTTILRRVTEIPGLVVHEAVHYNQAVPSEWNLTAATLREGVADFIADLVDPTAVHHEQWSFGCAHEEQLWRIFSEQMFASDSAVIDPWLYSSNLGPRNAPPFIGYWLGSRIAQTYYETHGRSPQAIREIVRLRDSAAFLKESGYPERRPFCAPPSQSS